MPESCFRAREISPGVFWVGAIDWDVRDFHGYETSLGSTYNAYLVTGEQNVLIDTVKAPFRSEFLERVASVTDRVDILISNHAEPDHTGSLPEVLKALRPKRLFASKIGAENIMAHYHDLPVRPETVENGSTMDLGGNSYTFLETRMLHWPDSMFTFMPGRNILFSQDAFGMHMAGADLMAHHYEPGVLRRESAMYYANILNPFSKLVTALLGRIAGLGIRPDIIAPDHGPVWFSGTATGPDWVTGLWKVWAEGGNRDSVVILYDTMWNATGTMARAVAEGAASLGVPVRVLKAGNVHRSAAALAMLSAGAVALGSPTLNNGIFPALSDHIGYLGGLRFHDRACAAFGSHGWSGEAVPLLDRVLSDWKGVPVGESLSVRFTPTGEELKKCRALGSLLARAVRT